MASFLQIFRLTFVIFSLYLIGDIFYRWDGFRYYASFSEFVPSVGLVAILWSVLAFIIAALLWCLFKTTEFVLRKLRSKIGIEHIYMFLAIFLLLNFILLSRQILKISFLPILLQWNLLSLTVIFIISLLLTGFFRNRAGSCVNTVQERIVPLVWIFAFFVVFSVPVVAYHTWFKETDHDISQKNVRPYQTDKNRPNILLVTFDAMTARDMSVYGYHRDTTPFITKWAKTASLFSKVEAESLITTPTTASLMTGKRLWTHQTYHISGSSKPVKSGTENLPLVLKKYGYYNMAFVVNPFASVRRLGIEAAFDIAPIETGFSKQANLFGKVDAFLYRLFGNRIKLYNWIVQRDFILFRFLNKISRNISKTTAPPEKAFNEFLTTVELGVSAPFFAWIHLYPPHDPYLPPEPFMGAFDPSSRLRTYKSQDYAIQKASRYNLKYQEFPPDVKPDVDMLRARYDEFIRYCDEQFEMFISQLAKKNILNNTIVILSSDHGESFEHNYIKHGFNNLYEQVTHIPLIIKQPGQEQGLMISDLTEQIDITATIIDLAGIPMPEWIEGRSLVPLMRGEELPPSPAFSMALEGQASRGNKITSGRIAVWDGDYKLIHQLDNNKSQLFNLELDRDELNDLFEKEAEVGQRLLKLIRENIDKANATIMKSNY